MSRKIVLFIDENIPQNNLNIKKIESQLPNADIKQVVSARKSLRGSSDKKLSERFFDKMKKLIKKDKRYFGFFVTCDKGLATESWVPVRKDAVGTLKEHCRLITICLWHNRRGKNKISKNIIQETRRTLRHQT